MITPARQAVKRTIVSVFSAVGRQSRPATCAARWRTSLMIAVLGTWTVPVVGVAQSTKMHDAFENLAVAAPQDLSIEQPAAVRPEGAAPSGPSTRWQSHAAVAQASGPLQWGKATATAPAPPVDSLPPPVVEGKVPLAGDAPSDVTLTSKPGFIQELVVRDKPLSIVLALLAHKQGLNIVASNDIDALISITLYNVPLEDALTAVLSVANYTWVERDGIILITSLDAGANLPADVQGRQIQVFELDYASATVVAEAVTGFLSPIGRVSISASDPADNRKTRELVVVEDLPGSLARIAAYIDQVDQPPRQVLIEAHVLQVTLTDDTSCGVNLDALTRLAGHNFQLKTTGFANEGASPAFVATLTGGDLSSVIEALQSTTDSKTLGSPKLLVLNQQEASVHVGKSIGYQTSTTTDVSVSQAPQFLDTGVTLRLTPRITRDGQVLLNVKPEVSDGVFNTQSNAPDKTTTELETNVMLKDSQGMIIGGLIKEEDSVTQSKIPYLGEVKGIGWLFRRSKAKKERVEIIFALVPRIQPYSPEYHAYDQGELVKAGVPLLEGPLCRTNRPWDPILPDGKRVYRPLIPRSRMRINRHGLPGSEYVVPPQPLPVQQFYSPECEPAWENASAYGPRRPLLSDEIMQLPPDGPAVSPGN